jgi:hypothetical protein
MAEYKHGITTTRSSDITTESEQAVRVQVAVGTAPVNLLDDPASAVNVPVIAYSRNDVKLQLGVCSDYDYTLMQTVLASFSKVGVAPVVMINVLDPDNKNHVTAVAGTSVDVINGSVTIEDEGILLDKLVVSSESKTGTAGTDYIAAFDSDGYVTIAIADDGAFKGKTSLTVAYTKLNPAGVTANDIIGGLSEDGTRQGIELVDEIYSRFGFVPDILSAPGFSTDAAVAAALEAKAELNGDLTNAIAVVDIESKTTTKLEDVKNAKNKLGCFTRWTVLCWPKVTMGGVEIFASAAVAAMLQYVTVQNGNVPTSPDNKDIPIDGVVMDGGKEVHYTMKQVNDYLNAIGVLSFVYLNGWKCWGNNTAAYPDQTDPNERYIKCVMMSNYIENRFKTEYLETIGNDASYKLIDSVVTNYNTDLSALVPDYMAGARIIFDKKENPVSSIVKGHFIFRTEYADYTPAEYYENTFVWKSKILEEAFEGGEEA